MKVVIIGGVAGGATAAARIRRLDEKAEIIILERSGFISYANCGLPYYIGGEIKDRQNLTLQTPQSFFARFRIDVRVHNEAISIDPKQKTVLVRDLQSGREYTESYDKLLLSVGAKPVVPDLTGADSPRVLTLRTVEDTFRIYDAIEKWQVKTAAVIGGGFIGLEMAENLRARDITVTLFQRSAHVMPPLDQDMAGAVHQQMRKGGIDLRLFAAVTGFVEEENGIAVQLQDAPSFLADLVILAVGVVPENTLAKQAGLQLGKKGAVCVNEAMETSEKDIYAVGDAVEIRHFVTNEKTVIPLAGPANKQGRIAADRICGLSSVYKGAQGSSILKMFDMTIAATGLNARDAEAAGYDFDYALITAASYATYYPGAENMTMKVLFEKPSGKLLGAQIIGYGGVDKRIDVLATAIRAGMTAEDLTELDLAYAPPYASAKDPVNMVGYVIENLLTGKVEQVHWEEVQAEKQYLLDVRTDEEVADGGMLQGAVHIPIDVLREHLDELPKEKVIYVYCQSGLRSYLACRILQANGFDCRNIAGGFGFYLVSEQKACLLQEGTGPCGMTQEQTLAAAEKRKG